MLHLRLRGNTWHVRGTVKVGTEKIVFEGESTGFARGEKAAAENYKTNREKALQNELLHGRDGRAARRTIADAIASFVERPEPISGVVRRVLTRMVHEIGDHRIANAPQAWARFVTVQLKNAKLSTIRRARGILAAVLNRYARVEDLDIRRLPTVRRGKGEDRVAFLSDDDRDRLLEAYNPRARTVALFLCYQGTRSSETLQLQWQHVDLTAQTAFIPDSKNLESRLVALHPKVVEALRLLHLGRGRPKTGPVFLTTIGEAYRDRRLEGANAFGRPHRTACKRAAIVGFTVHDWRHHWAVSMLRAGVDIATVKRLGGWRSLAALQRYINTLAGEHDHAAVRKVRAGDGQRALNFGE